MKTDWRTRGASGVVRIRAWARPEPLILALILCLGGVRPAESVDLQLSTNQETYARGDTLTLTIGGTPTGASNTGDVYIWVDIPDGSRFYYLGGGVFTPTVLPLARNVSVTAPVLVPILNVTITVGLPTGRYAFAAVMVRTGSTPLDSGVFLSVFATRGVRVF